MLPFPTILNNNILVPDRSEYDRFIVYIESRIQAGTITDGRNFPNRRLWESTSAKLYAYRLSLSDTLAMTGSVWGPAGAASSGSSIYRACQHSYPSKYVWDYAVSTNDVVLIYWPGLGSTSQYSAKNRNGYLSGGNSNGGESISLTNFIFYDPTLGRVRQVNPYTASAFSDFIF